MKKALILAVLGAGAVAQADSPEVLFVVNQGTDAIQRFDPISGANFGSFGGGILVSPFGVAVDSSGIVYVSDYLGTGSVIRKFNGFTGNYLGQLGNIRPDIIGGLTIGPDGFLYGSTTVITVGGSGGLLKMNRTTGVSQHLALAGAVNPTDVAFGVINIFVNAQNGTINVNPATFTQGSTVNTLPGTTFLNFDNDRSGWYQGGVGAQWGIGAPRASVFNFTGTPLGTSSGVSIGDMTNGHDLMYASVLDANGNGLIQRYDPLNQRFLGTFGNTTGWVYGSMACYTAPEPASMLAVGAGLAFLAKRRRNSRRA